MEDHHSEEQELNQDKADFMKETIKQRPLNRKKLIRRTLITAAMAVIFGLVACVTFLLLEPVISNKLYPEDEPSTVVLVEEKEEEEILPEDMIADDSDIAAESPSPTALQDEQIAQVLSEVQFSLEDYETLYDELAAVAEEVQKSMVTVVGITSDVDWFNNVYESEGAVSGVIVADNGKELLILTNYAAIAKAETLDVSFVDEMEYEAVLKQKDTDTGLAILAVAKNQMQAQTLEAVMPISLGSSAGNNLVGNPVIAIGQPTGVMDSVCYGNITSTSTMTDLPDAKYKKLMTDIYGSTQATGILVNLKGQVVGIIDHSHNSSDLENMVSAIGITDLRKIIERMSNNKEISYLGVYGADVSLQIHEELGVPYGTYVTEIDMDSPAMTAGIQSGDVISAVNGENIVSYQELISALLDAEPEETMNLTVLRQGTDGYAERKLSVVLGARS